MKVYSSNYTIVHPSFLTSFTSRKKSNKESCENLLNEQRLRNDMENLSNLNLPLISKRNTAVNLERYAASDLRNTTQTELILKKYPETSRNIGSIPYSWLENTSAEKRNERTTQIFDLFSNFAMNVSCARYDSPLNYKKQMADLASKLQSVTGKETEVEYLDEGTIGRTYKLGVGGENYVIKTFFTNPVGLGYYTRHGKGAEILSAVYAKQNMPKGYFADFYFGKFAGHDDTDGFMVTKYIDYDNAKTYIRNLMLYNIMEQPLKCGDTVNNTVLDTVIDYGEIEKGRLTNKQQYKLQRLILQAVLSKDIGKLDEIFTKYAGSDLDNVLMLLSKSFSSFCKFCNYSDVDVLSDDEIKIVNSDIHNRIFKLIFYALSNSDESFYNSILEEYKDTKELKYVLRLYNNTMTDRERETFARRVRKTELEQLSRIFKEADVIQ